MLVLLPIALAVVVAAAGGWVYLRVAPRRALDVPNARSSHSRPTLRGGGLVIIAGFYAGLAVWLSSGNVLSPRAQGWLAGALLVAGVSFFDDLRPLPALPRLITHAVGAVILTLAGVQQVGLGIIAALVFVLVLTNIYNFMDGIDGLAATQAVIVGCALAIAGLLKASPLLGIGGGLLAAGALGFLVYNLPPARLFMGDVGSTFLGFSFAGLSLLANIGVGGLRVPISFSVLLFAPFLFDGLLTLARRVVRGERWYAAHRSHYYQRLVQCGLTHGQVTGLYALLALVSAAAALTSLFVPDAVALGLGLATYAAMATVVVLVWRLEQPNHRPTVVTQG